MSSGSGASFKVYTAALDALIAYFQERRQALLGKESPSEYSFSDSVQFTQSWQQSLLALLKKLRAASFRCNLTFSAWSSKWEFTVSRSTTELALIPHPVEAASEMPPEAVSTQEALTTSIETALSSNTNLNINEVFNSIEQMNRVDQRNKVDQMNQKVTRVELIIRASLAKHQIPTPGNQAKVVYYLFAENFAKALKTMTLSQFESDFCESQKRTIVVVFDTAMLLTGEYLTLIGRDHDSEFIGETTRDLMSDSLKKATSTLEFRRSETLGDFRINWLTPDFFSVNWNSTPTNSTLSEIQRQLESIQALLSALFLADFVDQSTNQIKVEYRGIGMVRFALERTNLLKPQCAVENLHDLFNYAYEGFSADKLEIVQQFLSLMVSSDRTLCAKSAEVKEAARKTYAIVLRDKVSVYFDALNKIQERLKAATDKSAESAISLSRDVSSDLYKIAGVLVLALAAALLKPDFGWPVGLALSIIFAIYLVLAIYYQLATLTRAYSLQINHYGAYVDSFRPVLGEIKTEELLKDQSLKQANEFFRDRVDAAEQWYALFLVISLIMAQTSLHKLLTR